MPRRILSDQSAEFESILFHDLCELMAIVKVRISPFKPSTNGTVEQFHLILIRILAKIISQDQRNWCIMPKCALAAYRSTIDESTGCTPNRVFLGRENTMPIDIVMGAPTGANEIAESIDGWVAERRDGCVEVFDSVRESLGKSANVCKNRYDAGLQFRNCKESDWVFYLYPRRRSGILPKWQSFYLGPFLIVKIIASHNVVLQRSRRAKPFVVHCDKLKLCYEETPIDWRRCQEPVDVTAPPIVENNVRAEIRSSARKELSPSNDAAAAAAEKPHYHKYD